MEKITVKSCDGTTLKGMFAAATAWLEKSAEAVNALNVFPVPDGDTGTNMLLTMRSTMEAAFGCPENSASEVSRAMAQGSLMGARGNSGVILSQILRGLAKGLEDKNTFSGDDLTNALMLASEAAYKGVSQPVEGTILTVIREAACAAQGAAYRDRDDVTEVLQETVAAARDSVARTPSLLAVLREAGVVDAGGQGLLILLEGALRFLQGEDEVIGYQNLGRIDSRWLAQAGLLHQAHSGSPYGYCTEFVVRGQRLDPDEIKGRLETLGDSILVVGDENTARIHVHTLDPGAAISYGVSLGSLGQVKVDNMQDQHQGLLEAHRAVPPALALPFLKEGQITVVVVAPGDGVGEIFKSLGASVVVPGGQTMNPSVRELLDAIASAPSDQVILLPNNPNIVHTARETPALAKKAVAVVPSRTIPQGVAALMALNPDLALEENAAAMEAAMAEVQTIEVTRATRKVALGGIEVQQGKPIALLNDNLVAAGETELEVIQSALDKLELKDGSFITLYYGADVNHEEAAKVAEALGQRAQPPEVEVVYGGQPHYTYIISVE